MIKFCDDEKNDAVKIPYEKPTERTVRILSLSKATMCKIHKEGKEAERQSKFICTPERSKVVLVNEIVVDEIDEIVIRRKMSAIL